MDQNLSIKPIIIHDYVWISSNCTILPGVEIGKHSIIGAGSVVVKNIPEYSLVVGNPAHVIKKYDHTTSSWKSTASII